MTEEYCFPDYPWSIIKSYAVVIFDKTRKTKTAKLMKKFCVDYQQLLEDEEILPGTSFPFVYFYTMMKYRSHFNYLLFPRRRSHLNYGVFQELES